MFHFNTKNCDLLIIGAGGAGLRAAISAFDAGVREIAVMSKVIPTQSHTVAAKGGVNAALGNVIEDDWRWHAFDTIKAAVGLADEKAVELMCKNAAQEIIELEKMGVIFSRDENGKIAQRAYGAQLSDFGKGQIAYRACYSKDKTGHSIIHTLYQQALQRGVKFFNEFFVSDLLFDENRNCLGAVTIDLNEGVVNIFQAKAVIIATGGYGQIFKNTTTSTICSGDGIGLIARAGLELKDMEFIQFHPTGIYGSGFLITEGSRGEGAYLLNGDGERFMRNYDERMMELSSRDVIARAMATEIASGRGCGKDKKYLHLSLQHLERKLVEERLPGTVELVKKFVKIDVFNEDIPVAPSAHYSMGGIPTDIDGNVIFENKKVPGLMAIGEAACVSVHGANRLGCNSLLDILVFGNIAGKKVVGEIESSKTISNQNFQALAQEKIDKIANIFGENKSEISLFEIKNKLHQITEKSLGVFRNEALLQEGFDEISELFSQFAKIRIKNKNLIFNEDLVNYFEIENLLIAAQISIFAALQRKESRGAHFRDDYKTKDDKNYLAHILVNSSQNQLKFRIEPK